MADAAAAQSGPACPAPAAAKRADKLADNSAMATAALFPHLSPRRSILVRGAINQVVCALIALLLWTFDPKGSLVREYGYSFFIGNACWLLIDGARHLIGHWRYQRSGGILEWPGLAWMAPVVLLGTALGYSIGSSIGDAVFARRSPSLLSNHPALLISVLAGSVVVFIYYARERIHAQQLTTEAAVRQAAEAQLRLLQSQLEPHMLFNTLANLRVLIGIDARRAQTMLDHLIAFLRTTLAASRIERHPLAAEFDCVRDYLALMAIRMGPRLQVQLELPDALRDWPVPPMLLQPLVENAVKHGLEPKVAGGRIAVSAALAGAQLQLTVRDDGIGLQDPAAADGTHFGLEQVQQRLATLYGDRATLAMRPAAGGGTEAVLCLPPAPASPPHPT